MIGEKKLCGRFCRNTAIPRMLNLLSPTPTSAGTAVKCLIPSRSRLEVMRCYPKQAKGM